MEVVDELETSYSTSIVLQYAPRRETIRATKKPVEK
jgi:hypothetical protein